MTEMQNTPARLASFGFLVIFGCSLAAALMLYAMTNRYVLVQNQPTLRLLDRLTGQVSEWIVIDEMVTVDPLDQSNDTALKARVLAARRVADEALRKIAASPLDVYRPRLDLIAPRLEALKAMVSPEDFDLVTRYQPYAARKVGSAWVTLGVTYHATVEALRAEARTIRVSNER